MSDFIDDACNRPMDDIRRVGLTTGAVLLMGFGEACLRCRRPVPLGFACRYALANLLPSMVWRSIDLPLLCKASKVPLAEIAEASVLSEVLRTSRYIVASYGVLYHVLQWHSSHDPIAAVEKVMRLTTATSTLTHVSMQAHGDHIVPIDMDAMSTDDTQLRMQQWCLRQKDASAKDIFLLEVDLSSVGTSLEQSKQAMHTVRHLVEPFRGARAITKRMEALVVVLTSPSTAANLMADCDWDICVNTASVVVSHVLDLYAAATTTPPSASSVDGDAADEIMSVLPSPVIMIHTDSDEQFQHLAQGILQDNRIPVRFREGMSGTDAVHVLAYKKESNAIERLHVLLDQDVPATAICVVTEASFASPVSQVCVLHVPQLLDHVLQRIRSQLRCGMSSAEIQDSLRLHYGPMNTLLLGRGFRHDRHSKVA
ncbi:Aste57867_21575 [Aphanomyces stellatus]|uniref:Aste57867_21575 protein n=1 Tax=Aphanomyces stellatus TaxID=120398 RepID=A0A485LHW9_9STRA|nr:hypothetical protein As57867_021506 [Aphanomyces stellatus]VFT98245.1 Aste57867_21575 [Aphanomyces stellatus]